MCCSGITIRQRTPSGVKARSTSASAARARLRSITSVPKPRRSGVETFGPPSSDHAISTPPPDQRSFALGHRKRAVTRGVVEKLEDGETQTLRGFRLEHDSRTVDDDL